MVQYFLFSILTPRRSHMQWVKCYELGDGATIGLTNGPGDYVDVFSRGFDDGLECTHHGDFCVHLLSILLYFFLRVLDVYRRPAIAGAIAATVQRPHASYSTLSGERPTVDATAPWSVMKS
jgi:hypothetical protein